MLLERVDRQVPLAQLVLLERAGRQVPQGLRDREVQQGLAAQRAHRAQLEREEPQVPGEPQALEAQRAHKGRRVRRLILSESKSVTERSPQPFEPMKPISLRLALLMWGERFRSITPL